MAQNFPPKRKLEAIRLVADPRPSVDGYLNRLSLRMRGKLALGPGTGQADTTLGPTASQDGATVLGARAGQETKLTDATLLRGLERSFHERY
jgi:hypothetical protein